MSGRLRPARSGDQCGHRTHDVKAYSPWQRSNRDLSDCADYDAEDHPERSSKSASDPASAQARQSMWSRRAIFQARCCWRRQRRSFSSRRKTARVLSNAMARAYAGVSSPVIALRRVWRSVLEEGFSCGRHRIERLKRRGQALRARPRRRRLPLDTGERQIAVIAPNVLDRVFGAPAPNQKWVADFTYI